MTETFIASLIAYCKRRHFEKSTSQELTELCKTLFKKMRVPIWLFGLTYIASHPFYLPKVEICDFHKQIGGQKEESCAWFNGQEITLFDASKYVCLDNFEEKCLILSMTTSQNLIFEETMAEMGCQVLLYNPLLANHTHPNIEILPTLPFYIYEHAIVSFPSNSYYDASTTQFCIL